MEIASFIFFILAGLYGSAKRTKYSVSNRIVEAAIKYLLPGLFSSLLFIFGMFLVYLQSGTLRFSELQCIFFYFSLFQNTGILLQYTLLLVGFFFITVSFLFKLTVVPFHTWVVWVYSASLQSVVFFLATVAKFFYFLAFVRAIMPLVENNFFFQELFLLCGLLSLGVGAGHGVYELRFNVLLAFSGILNMGYSILSLSLVNFVGNLLALFNLVVYFFFIYVFVFYYRPF